MNRISRPQIYPETQKCFKETAEAFEDDPAGLEKLNLIRKTLNSNIKEIQTQLF